MIIDFATATAPWPSLDDRVMGGVSTSSMGLADGIATFSGEVSLAYGGGFASVRSRPGAYDLSAFAGLIVRARGDGREYTLRLRTSAAFDGVSYQAALPTETHRWLEPVLPFTAFTPVFRGRPVPDHPPLDPAAIVTFGLMTGGRRAGPFRLDLAWIAGWPGPA